MSEATLEQGINDKNTTNMPVGEILRRTRMHYKQTIPDIERALRIRASQIEAIESGDLKQLPGRVYAVGFVRSYSEFLGLDGDKMVELFKQQSAGQKITPELNFPVAPSDGKLPPLWLIGACVVVIIIALSVWAGAGSVERSNVNAIPPAPVAAAPKKPEAPVEVAGPEQEQTTTDAPAAEGEATAIDADPSAQTPEAAAAEQAAKANDPKEGIILNIRKNSWVEIKDRTGKTILSRVLQAGDQYFVPDRPDLTISIGNAAGVEFEIDGQKLKPLGEEGQVRRALPLDAAYLKKNFAPDAAGAKAKINP